MQLVSGSLNQPLYIVNSVSHSAHNSVFPDCSYPNLPTLAQIVRDGIYVLCHYYYHNVPHPSHHVMLSVLIIFM